MTTWTRAGAVAAAAGLPLIFDLDGVVVDVRASYRQAYVAGVAWYLRDRLGRAVAAEGTFTVADVALLKQHPGFNAPRDVVALCLRASLVAAQRSSGHLDVATCAVQTWLTAALRGGQLDRGADALFSGLDPATQAAVRAQEDVNDALQRCHEAYVGSAACQRVYGFAPRGAWPGLCAGDRLLLAVDRPACRRPVAVYSGRTRGEIAHLFERLPFFAGVEPARVHSADDTGAKPDPRPLSALIEALAAGGAVYFGDTPADRQTVVALRRQRADLRCLFAQVDVDGSVGRWPEADFYAGQPGAILDRLEA